MAEAAYTLAVVVLVQTYMIWRLVTREIPQPVVVKPQATTVKHVNPAKEALTKIEKQNIL